MSSIKPLERAVQILRGQTALARLIGGKVSQGHVWYWLNKMDGRLPAEYCIIVEQATAQLGSTVTRYELRPDVFGRGPPPADEQQDAA